MLCVLPNTTFNAMQGSTLIFALRLSFFFIGGGGADGISFIYTHHPVKPNHSCTLHPNASFEGQHKLTRHGIKPH